MSALDEIRRMKQQGIPEEQIVGALQEKGVSYREISEALAQNKIKAAVESPDPEVPQTQDMLQQTTSQEENFEAPQQSQFQGPQYQGMQESIMQSSQQPEQQVQEYIPQTQESYQGYGGEYQPYDYQQTKMSSDTIAEISEQVVSEKMDEVRKKIEKIIDFKTSIETKTESIEERLKRIEKIIDTLQSSVLKKVGDYVTNVEDIKKEMVETQKSFASIAGRKKEKAHKK